MPDHAPVNDHSQSRDTQLSRTFRLSRRRREMYSGDARLRVCLSVPRRIPTLLHGPGCNFGMVGGAL